ncbi:MAG TPA: class I SAM-dependent methyltransferase [Candidatus Acidoferrales bacterium]|nr:class I SAM-dependent methyltransferase [Candidatus Acidoferrales bacterium]
MDVRGVDTTGRFNERSRDYAQFRPSYAAAAVDAVLEGLAPPEELTIVDIGAGTGIATQLLKARGAQVIGVEPNEQMRAQALALGCDVRLGNASATGLPNACADVVTAFQAFHWFCTPEALREFRRVIRPHGRLAAVWNFFDRSDAFTDEFCRLYERYGDTRHIAGLGIDESRVRAFVREHGFGEFRKTAAGYEQFVDFDGMLGRLRSSGSMPRDGAAYEALAAHARRLYDRFAQHDRVTLVQKSAAFVTETA